MDETLELEAWILGFDIWYKYETFAGHTYTTHDYILCKLNGFNEGVQAAKDQIKKEKLVELLMKQNHESI